MLYWFYFYEFSVWEVSKLNSIFNLHIMTCSYFSKTRLIIDILPFYFIECIFKKFIFNLKLSIINILIIWVISFSLISFYLKGFKEFLNFKFLNLINSKLKSFLNVNIFV